jgi:hypothetical protein
MKLYFQNYKGEERLIADVDSEDEAIMRIKKFCSDRDFTIPYWRNWGYLDSDGVTYDVGSHTEFFKLRR